MQAFKTTLLTIAFAMSALAPATTYGQESGHSARRITGTIVEIDRSSRILKIQDRRNGTVITARVPERQMLTLRENANPGSMPRSIPFEHAMRGLVVDVIVVTMTP